MKKVLKFWKEVLIVLLVGLVALNIIIGDSPPNNLTDYDIKAVEVEWEKDDDVIRIEGYFENDDRVDIIFIEYVVFLLDGRGNIISADSSISDGVKAGGEVYFDTLAINHKGVRNIKIQIVSIFEEWR